MNRPQDWPLDQCIATPAICDFDELLGDHPALLREVMGQLPTTPHGGTTEKRAKFLAMREWIMLSSAFDVPCYFCEQDAAETAPSGLWIRLLDKWIGETQLPDGLFPEDNPGPERAIPYPVAPDPVMRHHINVWLIQIEMTFQAWWRASAEGCLAVQDPNGVNVPLRDVSEQVFTLPADLRARAVATNRWPDSGAKEVSGRIFLHRPSAALVAWRRSMQEASALGGATKAVLGEVLSRRL